MSALCGVRPGIRGPLPWSRLERLDASRVSGRFCCLRHDYVAFDLADFPGSLVFNLPGFRLKFGSDLFKHDAIGVIAGIPLASRSS